MRKIRQLGSAVAGKAGKATGGLTGKALQKAVTKALDVIDLAAVEASKREIHGREVTLTSSISLHIVNFEISVEFSPEQLKAQAETAKGRARMKVGETEVIEESEVSLELDDDAETLEVVLLADEEEDFQPPPPTTQ